MPTNLTPDARRRVEEALERMDGHRHGCLANVMMECTCGRDLARAALLTTVAALVSEGEERGRGDTVMACVDVVREVYPAGRNRARAVDAMRRIGDPFAARATAKPPEVE